MVAVEDLTPPGQQLIHWSAAGNRGGRGYFAGRFAELAKKRLGSTKSYSPAGVTTAVEIRRIKDGRRFKSGTVIATN
jgi:hypothetical protein